MVRTTVTLEHDVAAGLRQMAGERGITFKEAINSTLRAGLQSPGVASAPYREETRRLAVRPEIDLTKALRLAAELEDEEILRKLDVAK